MCDSIVFSPGYLMYRSGLVHGWPCWASSAGPRIFASATAVLLGADEQTGTHFIFSLPEIGWEASRGIYLIAKGFKRSHILS